MGNLSKTPEVFISFSSLSLLISGRHERLCCCLGEGGKMQLDKTGENGVSSFPGSEMLGEQNLVAKLLVVKKRSLCQLST